MTIVDEVKTKSHEFSFPKISDYVENRRATYAPHMTIYGEIRKEAPQKLYENALSLQRQPDPKGMFGGDYAVINLNDLGTIHISPDSDSNDLAATYYYGETIILESHTGIDPESGEEYSYCDVHFMPLGATNASELRNALYTDPETQLVVFDEKKKVNIAEQNFKKMQAGIESDLEALNRLLDDEDLPKTLIFTPGDDVQKYIEDQITDDTTNIRREEFEELGQLRWVYLTDTSELPTFLSILSKREFDIARHT